MKIEQASSARNHPHYAQALITWLYQLADDELTLGHRDSEWLGLCPDIEGDVAFSSIAQDEVGHAVFYFHLLEELGEKDPDQSAFLRPLKSRCNALILERSNGDWAYSIARHMLYDQWDALRLKAMLSSSYSPLKQGAEKILREEYYHLLHMKTWFIRLGKAGGEAKKRLTDAAYKIWPDLGDFFYIDQEEALLQFDILRESAGSMKKKWEEQVKALFQQAGIPWPGPIPEMKINGRKGEHTEDLRRLLDTMGEVHALDPTARW